MNLVALDGQTLNPGDNPWDAVAQLGDLKVWDRTPLPLIRERACEAEVLIVNKVPLTEERLAELPKLKLVTVTATGFNNVCLEQTRKQGIVVCNVPAYSTDSVAQHVFAMLLSWIHQPELHHDAILNGAWRRAEAFSFWLRPITELAGKTMGIVGWGRIGKATARLAQAFGMQVIAASRSRQEPLPSESFSWADLDDVFRRSDVLSLHCPSTPETQGIVNHDRLAMMRPHSILINTARGELIDEPDLVDALQRGRPAAALLDVVSQEPIPDDHPLLSLKNCRLTPHLGWSTLEARQRAMQITADNIRRFLAGEPQNVVNGSG